MNSLCKKTKKVTFRMTESDYEQYLSLFEHAKTKRDKKFTVSDFVRDCIFNKEVKNIKVVKTTPPSKCQKQRLNMLVSSIKNIEFIAIKLTKSNKNHNFNKYLSMLENIHNILKGELS